MSQQLCIKDYQPPIGKTVLDICFYLSSKFQVNLDAISPDGNSAFETTGTINYYAFKGVFSHPVEEISQALTDFGYTISKAKSDKSRIYGCPVWRIEVLDNPFSHIEEAPVLQISESNVGRFKNLLNLPLEENGYWHVDTLQARLNEIGSGAMVEASVSPTVMRQGGLTIHDMGCDFDRIQGYLDRTEEVLTYAKGKGFTHVAFC